MNNIGDMDELLNNSNNRLIETSKRLNEMDTRMKVIDSSKRILERIKETNPKFYPYEVIYQDYRKRFSPLYFSMSDWYRGDCLCDWVMDNISDKRVFSELFSDLIALSLIERSYKRI